MIRGNHSTRAPHSDEDLARMVINVAEATRADSIICITETGALARHLYRLSGEFRVIATTTNSETFDTLTKAGLTVIRLPLHTADKYTQIRHATSVVFQSSNVSVGDLIVCTIVTKSGNADEFLKGPSYGCIFNSHPAGSWSFSGFATSSRVAFSMGRDKMLPVSLNLFLAIYQFNFDPRAWYIAVAWIIVGLFIYFMYFEKVTAADMPQVLEVQQSKSTSTYPHRILVPLHNPDHVIPLMKLAVPIARAHEGVIIVLGVIDVPIIFSIPIKFYDKLTITIQRV